MARDVFHEDVRIALQQEGWTITHDPYLLKAGDLNMEVDLAAEKTIAAERENEKILVEVKSFLSKSKLHDFYEAKGQYDIYRRGLAKNNEQRKLYLAIDEEIYLTFFQKTLIQETVSEEKIYLLVFNHQTQSIVQWID